MSKAFVAAVVTLITIVALFAACGQRGMMMGNDQMMEHMRNNPEMMQRMMGQMMNDPEMMQQMMGQMMSDPEMMQRMMGQMMNDPEMMQQMRRHCETMMEGAGASSAPSSSSSPASHSTAGVRELPAGVSGMDMIKGELMVQ